MEKRGGNQYREGTQDPLEGQGEQKHKQKCRITNKCTARYAEIVVMRHAACPRSNPVPKNDPKRLCGTDLDPASHSLW